MSDRLGVSRLTLRQGAVYMLLGLLWGGVVPLSPFPRLTLGAHLQLATHGVMYLVVGLVILHLPIVKGSISAKILVAGPWLTWPVMLTEMANGWWGTKNMLPLAARLANAPGAANWKEGIVTAAHVFGAVALIVYFGTILVLLFRKPSVPFSE